MKDSKLTQIVKEGIYGKPELRPEEKHLFLGTFAERVYLALTNGQVYKAGMYEEAIDLIKRHSDIRLLINGNLPYTSYSNYVKEAGRLKVPFTVHNDFHFTPLGIVLTSDYKPVQKSYIYIEDDIFERDMEEAEV
ncbi:YueI family protein [Alkalicoccus luteus]|uniref:YueI family protein n=1 Tax=Alkalicoccus luteus TaxID=1237094 RepID=A0A969PTL8_9BACI|nr:YueI family protein [Alkalicoccus luteus]NJP37668.1 YueI family protein [Alkalicoccus luteus]